MDVFGKIGAMHPIVIAAWGALILVDGFLIYHAARHYHQYRFSQNWPRLEVPADSVDVQRVVYSRDGVPGSQEHYEAVFNYRYHVNGRDYVKQNIRSVADAAEAERLRTEATIAFIYNPDNPEETLEKPPGRAPLVITLAGLVLVTGIGLGLIRNITAFLSGPP